jgi:hypothetical protein
MLRPFVPALALVSFGLVAPAQAGVINTFDNPGDIVLSPTQAPGAWYTDRYAPAGFAAGQSGGGRTGVLALSLSDTAGRVDRSAPFNTAFYNTQGRKFDLASGTTSLFIDLYVPATGTAGGRYAGLWATAVDGANAIAAYPIIEAANGGFQVWDTANPMGGWHTIAGFSGTDQWYEIGFDYANGQYNYYINGQLVKSFSAPPATFSNVILQGYNTETGVNRTINFDNLSTTSSVPEPATVVTIGLLAGAVGIRLVARRKRGEPAAV